MNKPKARSANLTPKQELFCQLYASDREFFGNGVASYMEAYDCAKPKVAAANASRMLTNANILQRINQIFEAHGLNDAFVDKQLEKLIVQDADFKSKLGAIKEYNAMKNRIKQRVDITSGDQTLDNPFANLTTDELRKLIKK